MLLYMVEPEELKKVLLAKIVQLYSYANRSRSEAQDFIKLTQPDERTIVYNNDFYFGRMRTFLHHFSRSLASCETASDPTVFYDLLTSAPEPDNLDEKMKLQYVEFRKQLAQAIKKGSMAITQLDDRVLLAEPYQTPAPLLRRYYKLY